MMPSMATMRGLSGIVVESGASIINKAGSIIEDQVTHTHTHTHTHTYHTCIRTQLRTHTLTPLHL
jgi:hypothetical protein